MCIFILEMGMSVQRKVAPILYATMRMYISTSLQAVYILRVEAYQLINMFIFIWMVMLMGLDLLQSMSIFISRKKTNVL